jgi:hypothetical protein
MKQQTFDRNLYTQIGLDSGALTMLATVVHTFREPGEYRGTIRKEGDGKGTFYICVDKESPVAHADIDLASLTGPGPGLSDEGCDCRGESAGGERRFTVNPRGYVMFRVASGPGGYNVHVRKAAEAEDTKIFDSRKLGDGALFSATILRPGTYSVTNALGKGRADLTVSYPVRSKTAYRPPAALRVSVTAKGFEPSAIKLAPAQGVIFECAAQARIKIDLVKPDDGPAGKRKAA